ncbi:alpha/beta hydrolase [Achromobacter pestifer]|uniref:Alpha/beta hydrolase n=1 Tax=Achromobacter pestifer TaxID=1353889 RepID=A0A7D4E7A9_9BURK|nr:alpha/beta hydrolase [Achromobacter pestifer]QKH36866.1 alpha/beta hydrolase [Achromobacter pestifer]
MKSYKLIGNGLQKVLLFPGLLGTQNAFDEALHYADVERYQYAVVDYRGYGASKNLAGLFTLCEAVIDACKLVEFLGWQKFSVGGHSMGALTAQMVAIAMPRRVASIISIAGVSAKGTKPDAERAALLKDAARDPKSREKLVVAGTADRYTEGFARAMVAATFDQIAPDAFASYAKDASRTDVSDDARILALPMLALVGQFDPACGEQVAREKISAIYAETVIEVVQGAGHYPHVEAPAATVSAVERFLAASGG